VGRQGTCSNTSVLDSNVILAPGSTFLGCATAAPYTTSRGKHNQGHLWLQSERCTAALWTVRRSRGCGLCGPRSIFVTKVSIRSAAKVEPTAQRSRPLLRTEGFYFSSSTQAAWECRSTLCFLLRCRSGLLSSSLHSAASVSKLLFSNSDLDLCTIVLALISQRCACMCSICAASLGGIMSHGLISDHCSSMPLS
jgi:hypothetical protein